MKPVLQALVVADRIYVDRSGKVVICGTFNKVFFANQPPVAQVQKPDGTMQTVLAGGLDMGAPWVYMSLTDVCANTELLLQFTNISKNQSIFATKLTVHSSDRLQTIEITAPMPRLPITEAGTYAVEVLCEGEILGSHRIIAEQMAAPQLPPPQDH